MDPLINTLSQIGLDEKQAKIYLAVLELGSSTVLPISKKSKIKRTYCYDILSILVEKGLVSFIVKNNRRRYFAEDPKKIEDSLKNKLTDFEQILPELKSIHNNSSNKPKVKFYEGLEGIVSIYEQLRGVKQLDAIGSPELIEKNIGNSLKNTSQIITDKLTIRELIPLDSKPAFYHQYFKKPYHISKRLPKGINLKTDLMIFGNKLALISYGETPHAVVIEDSSIVETQKALFEILWQTAK